MIRVLAERSKRRSRLFEIAHPGDDVDDRFGRDAGNGCAANVVDTALQPGSKHPLQESTLDFKAPGPCGVILDDGYPLVGHRLSVTAGRLAYPPNEGCP
jgi:hypothetical protein